MDVGRPAESTSYLKGRASCKDLSVGFVCIICPVFGVGETARLGWPRSLGESGPLGVDNPLMALYSLSCALCCLRRHEVSAWQQRLRVCWVSVHKRLW